MDRRERAGSMHEVMLQALTAWQARLWTAMPGVVQSYKPSAGTVVVQVAIKAQVRDQRGLWSWVDIPQLVDVPVCFPSGGGFSLTFPLAQGDEVLVIFASRCIDAWWQSSGVQQAMEPRMHDLSDAFAIPGPKSAPRVISGMSASDVVLRNDAGDTYVSISPSKTIKAATPGNVLVQCNNLTANVTSTAAVAANAVTIDAASIHLTGPTSITGDVVITGSVTVTGNTSVTGALMNNGVNVGSTHTHYFVDNDDGDHADWTNPPG